MKIIELSKKTRDLIHSLAEGFSGGGSEPTREALDTFNVLFEEHLEEVRAILAGIDRELARPLVPARLPLYEETRAIYGARERRAFELCERYGWHDCAAVEYVSEVVWGPRAVVVVQQKNHPDEASAVFVYIYNEEPLVGESSMVFYEAPNILGSA